MRTLLVVLLFIFVLLSGTLGVLLYFCKQKECPEITHINEFIEAETLEPISVEPVIDTKFDALFGTTEYTHKNKPTLKQKVTGKHNYHRVKKGENLYRIGLKYGISYNFLMKLNGFKTVDIKAGQWIYLGTKEERLQHISEEAQGKADSLYIYNKRYHAKDSTSYADVYTESYGPIVRQAVDLHMKAELDRKLRFGLGVALSNNISSPYEVRGGFLSKNTLYTAGVGVGEKTIISVGVMKFIK